MEVNISECTKPNNCKHKDESYFDEYTKGKNIILRTET